MRIFRRFGIALLVLLGASPAFAATFGSGVLQATTGSRLVCVVTNFGTKPVTVAIDLLDIGGAGNLEVIDPCVGLAIPPGSSCSVHSSADFPNTGFCRVVVKGNRVRGSLLVQEPGGKVTASLPLLR
jgi:hypothetical protein